jgi:esterase/lipase superfamily enzyme
MKFRNGVVLLLTVIALAGCATSRSLMPTPNLYAAGREEPFVNISPELKTNRVELFYVTDRKPEKDKNGRLAYGYGRSNSIAFGMTTVKIGENVSWEKLLENSRRRERTEDLELSMGPIVEKGRFPPTPLPFSVLGGFYEHNPAAMKKVRAVEKMARKEISRRLALTPRKEVIVFIHGFANTFEDAAFTLAEVWHFMGREGVPILYTWPAGFGGPKGYTYDRESGEFTVYHLKMFLKALGRYDEVEKVHLIAHSRGTDVLATALRELFIESRAAGFDPRKRFKIENLVLAAPDLDFSVLQQRMMTEPISPGIGQITIYVSKGDKALGLATWLFGGLERLGRLGASALGKGQVAGVSASVENANFIDLKGEGGSFGHGYFHDNPAVSSDLIQVIRYDRRPGKENGRPLKKLRKGFWVITDDYLLSPKKAHAGP